MTDDEKMELMSYDKEEMYNDIDEDPIKKEKPKPKKKEEKRKDDDEGEQQESEASSEDIDVSNATNASNASSASNIGMAAVSGPLAGVVAVTVLLMTANPAAISFEELQAYGKNIQYEIVADIEYDVSTNPDVDWNNTDTGYTLVVSDGEDNITKPLITGEAGTEVSVEPKSQEKDNTIYKVKLKFSGTVEDLKENQSYKVSVIGEEEGAEKAFCSKEVKILGPLTEIRGVTGYCSCTIDGKYHFSLDYTDDNNFYQSFSYRLLDKSGNAVASGEITDPKAEQEILDVDKLKGKNFTLEIKIESSKPEDVEANDGLVVLTQDISI